MRILLSSNHDLEQTYADSNTSTLTKSARGMVQALIRKLYDAGGGPGARYDICSARLSSSSSCSSSYLIICQMIKCVKSTFATHLATTTREILAHLRTKEESHLVFVRGCTKTQRAKVNIYIYIYIYIIRSLPFLLVHYYTRYIH